MDYGGETIEIWDAPQLMGRSASSNGHSLTDAENAECNNGETAVLTSPRRMSRKSIKGKAKDAGIDVLKLWGQPGYLTKEEADVYVSHII
jgi:hypothetical protein